ncbi:MULTISPECIES: transporter substrate-binding domain-containing protein [Halomonadaceae]|uniref:Lysine/arginine/ornithine-binding periplasmic protein n=1 Tax=Vreelandella titanicae TaxID=664683 RepID=A0AAP9NKJ9_9GAMM|nr:MULTISPECIES: transporter substrate-binding domain-containing protein [Halomonas]QKS23587.1 Lysine/arginine/ornithine-binding periplasmic protein [Halomonas titanicae]TDV87149.1 arginine/ornithine transport system substrate-binding protein [Halomonas alkaliantarctica]CDG55170.1 Extracellular solute-binding protein [Halomonas sp. A3H3]SDI37161.1 amino acid ABC transporter substrate-binding protein, PAAT family [Halomonas titanicae]
MSQLKLGVATALTSLMFALPAYSDSALRLAVDVPFEPFQYRLPDGSLTGFEVELGEEVCRRIERECEWVEQSWDGIIPGLLARKYDAIVSSMAITDARREQVLFSEPYYSNPSVWVTQVGKEIDTEDRTTLAGLSVGVQRGTIRDAYITDTYGDLVDVRRYATGEDLAVDIQSGRLDAAFMYYPLALSSLQVDQEGSGVVTSSALIRDPKSYFGHGVAAAFHPRNEALAEQFNEALSEIKEDGTYDKLMNKYVDYDIKI